jgi:short-subunit dehydrogenase
MRCRPRGCEVVTVKLGFVNTKMTEHLHLPAALVVEPERLAWTIRNKQQQKFAIIYPNFTWKFLAFVVRLLPEGLLRLLPK